MLKQPLLSRMFKPSGTASNADQAPATSTALLNEPSGEELVAENSDSATPERVESALASAVVQLAEKATAAESTEDGQKSVRKKWVSLPARPAILRKKRSAIALGGLLLTAAGFAFMRFAPASARASLKDKVPMLSERVVPLRANSDPTAESLIDTSKLYLTNQILYRKLEAIAGVSLDVPAPTIPTLPTAGSGGPANKPAAAKPSGAKPEAGDPNSNNDGQNTQQTDVEQAERVKADAPPAPAIAPTEFSGTTIDSVLEMRVAVAKDVPAVGIATSSNGVITDLDGNALKSLSAEQGVIAEIDGGIVVDGENMPSVFWVYPEDGGYVAVGDRWYRGRVLVALRERGLIAVNYVLLGDYLYSVVGSEMSPGWAIESLKAQAVAARSYALTHNIHPASEDYFDLDNTQRFQAYKGIGREANTTQAAVQATAGEFISHEGGIVESLYAASQAIVDDAHKGSGMSQLGAKDLAEQGYSYQEILAHYYPGTALGRLETDPE
ncbi:MAG: SpoIID/LytB domain-containing protein [Cyanobacteria bacterium J06648_10]